MFRKIVPVALVLLLTACAGIQSPQGHCQRCNQQCMHEKCSHCEECACGCADAQSGPGKAHGQMCPHMNR